MFIIEGSDSLGKTTLAKRIVEMANSYETYPIRYEHMTRPSENFNFNTDYLDMMSHFAVMDRFHLGAMVWHMGVMCRETLRWLEAELAMRGSFTLVLHTSADAWYKEKLASEDRNQAFDDNAIMVANTKFRSLMHHHADATYDTEETGDFPPDKVVHEWIHRWFKRLERTGYLNDGRILQKRARSTIGYR